MNVAQFDIQAALGKVPLLSSLGKQQKRQLGNALITKTFASGQDIMREGQEGDFFLIIVEGKVAVKSAKGGHLAYLYDGDYAGEQALLKETTRNATLTAVVPTTCFLCSKHTVHQIKNSVKFANRDGKKRKAFATNIETDDMKLPEIKKKPQETVKWILECVSYNLLFLKLDREQKERVVQRMRLVSVQKKEVLIQQHDANAHTFYVTESGTFDVLVDGFKVGHYKRGGCFGELALVYDSPRAATILATSNATVWEVNRNAFRYEIEQASRSRNDANINDANIAFLKRVDLFKPLLTEELQLVADALEVTKYKKGSVVIEEGEVGDKFYVIQAGTCTWSKSNGEHGNIEALAFFGELALRTKANRAATITAKTDVRLLEMTKTDFDALLEPVIEIVDDKIRSYRRMADKFEKEKRVRKSEQMNGTNGHVDDAAIPQFKQMKNKDAYRDQVCELGKLKTVGVLGKGTLGSVSLVIDPYTNRPYALKAIKKHQIVELRQQARVLNEKRVMQKMYNQFLVNLHRTYKDELRLYFVLDVYPGGDLFTILQQRKYFNEPTAKFYASCVVEAIAYMHSQNIIYRNLKPANLVLDNRGYLKLTDFGFAKQVTDKTFTMYGSPDYLAPEIMIGQGHGRAVDWWALGVLIYEMLASFPPFFDDEPMETYRKIIRGRVKFPHYFTPEARDVVRGLLCNKPLKRLGILKGGADNIRKHGWFYGFKWDALCEGTLTAPIINPVRSNEDLNNSQDEEALPVAPADDFGDEFADDFFHGQRGQKYGQTYNERLNALMQAIERDDSHDDSHVVQLLYESYPRGMRGFFEDYHSFINDDEQQKQQNACTAADCAVIERQRRRRANYIAKQEPLITMVTTKLDNIHVIKHHMAALRLRRSLNDTDDVGDEELDEKRNDDSKEDDAPLINSDKFFTHFNVSSSKSKYHSYSFGARFFYHKHYQNSTTQNEILPGTLMAEDGNLHLHHTYTFSSWFIEPKFASIKDEVLDSGGAVMLPKQYVDNLIKQAESAMKFIAKQIPQNKYHVFINVYNIERDAPMTLTHILSVVMYTTCTELSSAFSKSYRKLSETETDDSLKQRHAQFYHWAKALREVVEVYGTSMQESKHSKFFHGIDYKMLFAGFRQKFCCPTSTTISLSVAKSFAKGKDEGIVVTIENTKNASMFFNCKPFSDYPLEEERLFVGGWHSMEICNIYAMKEKNSYKKWIKAIRVFDIGLIQGVESSEQVTETNKDLINLLVKSVKSVKSDDTIPVYILDLFENMIKKTTWIHINLHQLSNDHLYTDDFDGMKYYGYKFLKDLYLQDSNHINWKTITRLYPSISGVLVSGTQSVQIDDAFVTDISTFLMSFETTQIQQISVYEPTNDLDSLKHIQQKYEEHFASITYEMEIELKASAMSQRVAFHFLRLQD